MVVIPHRQMNSKGISVSVWAPECALPGCVWAAQGSAHGMDKAPVCVEGQEPPEHFWFFGFLFITVAKPFS